MVFLQSAPHPALQNSIAQYLYASFNSSELPTVRQSLLPYDIPAFSFFNGPLRIEHKKSLTPGPISATYKSVTSFFVGLTTSPYTFVFGENKNITAFIVPFKPFGFSALFRRDMEELTNEISDFNLLAGATNGTIFIEQLAEAKSFTEQIKIADDFFIKRISDGRSYGQIGEACRRLIVSNGLVNMKDLAYQTNMSLSTLERQFSQRVGISPKLFARFKRFHHALALMNCKKQPSLSDVTFRCGYYDQAHFIKEFRTFSEFSPSAYSPAEYALYNQFILFRNYPSF